MTIQAVIFDMDGVLIDSEPVWKQSGLDVFREIGIEEITLDDMFTVTGLPALSIVNYMYKKYNKVPMPAQEAADYLNNYAIQKILSEKPLITGVKETLALLKQLGLKMAVASASPLKLLEEITQSCGITDYFSYLSSATQLAYNKPHPEVYLQAAKMLKVNPNQCIGIEDSIIGMTAVKAASMKCIAIPAEWQFNDPRYTLAEVKLASITDITPEVIQQLNT